MWILDQIWFRNKQVPAQQTLKAYLVGGDLASWREKIIPIFNDKCSKTLRAWETNTEDAKNGEYIRQNDQRTKIVIVIGDWDKQEDVEL